MSTVYFDSIKRLFDYRFMIRSMVKREIRGRYKGSLLGFLWNFITPFVQVLVYILVFSNILKPGIEDYGVFLVIGIVPWIFFSDSLISSSATMVENCEMIKKIYFPRSILPISVVLSKVINYLISMVIVFAVIGITGHTVNYEALLILPLAIILFLLFTTGLALLLSSVNVYLRDTSYIINVLMMILIWLSPIMYMRDLIDNELLNVIIAYNPITYFIELFQDLLYWGTMPSVENILLCILLALISMIVGAVSIHYLERDFAEVL